MLGYVVLLGWLHTTQIRIQAVQLIADDDMVQANGDLKCFALYRASRICGPWPGRARATRLYSAVQIDRDGLWSILMILVSWVYTIL